MTDGINYNHSDAIRAATAWEDSNLAERQHHQANQPDLAETALGRGFTDHGRRLAAALTRVHRARTAQLDVNIDTAQRVTTQLRTYFDEDASGAKNLGSIQ